MLSVWTGLRGFSPAVPGKNIHDVGRIPRHVPGPTDKAAMLVYGMHPLVEELALGLILLAVLTFGLQDQVTTRFEPDCACACKTQWPDAEADFLLEPQTVRAANGRRCASSPRR